MAKKPTAKQIAARKKFAAAVKAGKFRKKKKPAKKRVAKKRAAKKIRRRSVAKKRVAKKTTIASLKSRICDKLDDQLKELLFRRDKATTRKQHVAAQKKITAVRSALRKLK